MDLLIVVGVVLIALAIAHTIPFVLGLVLGVALLLLGVYPRMPLRR